MRVVNINGENWFIVAEHINGEKWRIIPLDREMEEDLMYLWLSQYETRICHYVEKDKLYICVPDKTYKLILENRK